MEEYHTLLDGAVGTAPPSTVDIGGIVRAGRRGARLRGAGVFGGTAVVVAGMLAGTVMLAGAGRSGGVPVGALSPAVTSPASAPAAPPTGAPTRIIVGPCRITAPGVGARQGPVEGPSGQVVLPRLVAALQAATTAVSGTASPPIPFNYDGVDGYRAAGMVRIGVRSAYLAVVVEPRQPTVCTGAANRGGVVATTGRGKGGERIVSWTDSGGPDPANRTRNVVVVQKPDGTDVRLYASSFPVSADGQVGELLSISQLTGIGLDPRISVRR
jgi:hypothetical protein